MNTKKIMLRRESKWIVICHLSLKLSGGGEVFFDWLVENVAPDLQISQSHSDLESVSEFEYCSAFLCRSASLDLGGAHSQVQYYIMTLAAIDGLDLEDGCLCSKYSVYLEGHLLAVTRVT